MKELFKDVPESIDNTNIIVAKVEVLNLKRYDILSAGVPYSQRIPGTWRFESQPVGIFKTYYL